ncbi:MAG: rRNA maturation RNase YbeY [Acidobacteria bacterium]|nr:rRNA maturation RNase YbeY [Acidobacteriota bacterium]
MTARRGGSVGEQVGRGLPRGLAIDVVMSTATRAPGLAQWLAATAPARARGRVTVAIVPDSRVRRLNRVFRHMDRPTDVLSFPFEEPERAPRRARHPGTRARAMKAPGLWRGVPDLGDVVIAAGVARRQAESAGHSLQTELRVLALHGLLHLLGYDHERDDGRMGRLEARLRRRGGLREGLIERQR